MSLHICTDFARAFSHINKELLYIQRLRSKFGFFWFDTINLGWSIVYIKGSHVILSKCYCISFSEDYFCLNNQCRPPQDEMAGYTNFIDGLHCLPKTHLGVTSIQRVKVPLSMMPSSQRAI